MLKKAFLLDIGKCSQRITGNRFLSLSPSSNKSYKLVVVGGGTGGCSIAAKFSAKLGKGKVAVIEPSQTHYYQPLWTLVGGGMKKLEQSAKPMKKVLPSKADWIQERAVSFNPENNLVVTESGNEINYDFLVIAMGLELKYEKVKGLPEAFERPEVGSIYSSLYVTETERALKAFKGGDALFTVPNTHIKCPGAPLKIMFIFEDYQRKIHQKFKTKIVCNTGQPVLFFSKYYADVLWDISKSRDITINLNHNLVEVKPDTREAVFQNLENPQDLETFPYHFLHVTPPMSSPDVLSAEKKLVDETGYLDVHKTSLQHVTYPNIFGIGDCTNVPTPKTAAAVAAQLGVLRRNLTKAMENQSLTSAYDGYTSCPVVTGYKTCIMSEFDFTTNPMETFPVDQRKERRSMFHIHRDLIPFLYWNTMLKGYWEGPKTFRKLFHFGFK